ncbi:hypothetical protein [Lewinella sp. IMCC34183]|uniref:hypothetical protein n=1 Tax=Lewinella sp. IMCC34183 TaxID=2248762 RepID=UPI000E24F018|nr:hypothetical protein [Lewinella sp. IMCC34183]
MNHRIVTCLLFGAYLLLGWTIVDDYGISFDEAIQRGQGLATVELMADRLGIDHPPLGSTNSYFSKYGMMFQIVSVLAEVKTGALNDPYRYYRIRHVLGFLLFGVALAFFYRTLRLRWPSHPWYPLVGTLLLLLMPRLFAHAFFNPKDHILLVFYVVATFTLANFLRKRTTASLVWHMIASSLAVNARLPGLIVVGATVALLLWEQLFTRPGNFRRMWQAPVYLAGTMLFTLPFFPYIWEAPVARLAGALETMTKFPYAGENLIFGTLYPAGDPPAWYLPAWILIGTPIVYLLFIAIGLVRTGVVTVRQLLGGRMWRDFGGQLDFVQLGLSVGPLLVVIALGATVYNGWRHVHFVYPGLAFLGMTGFDLARRRWPLAAPVMLGGGLIWTAIVMVRMHPQQQVYLNEFVTDELPVTRYEMDYWGAGYREAFIRYAETVPEGEVRNVKCTNWPCVDNVRALPPPWRDRLRVVEFYHEANVVATNFLWPTERAYLKERTDVFEFPLVEVAPRGDIVVGIYELNW